MAGLVAMIPFWLIMIALVPLAHIFQKKLVALHILSICAFPAKKMFIWMYIFSYHIYIYDNNAYIDLLCIFKVKLIILRNDKNKIQ